MSYDKVLKELLKIDNNIRIYNDYKDYDLKQLINILNMVLKNNINSFENNQKDIDNLSELSHYKRYELTNKLNYSNLVFILNYLISDKLNDNV